MYYSVLETVNYFECVYEEDSSLSIGTQPTGLLFLVWNVVTFTFNVYSSWLFRNPHTRDAYILTHRIEIVQWSEEEIYIFGLL